MTDDPVEVVFTHTPDEYIRAIRRYHLTQISLRRDLLVCLILIAAGIYLYLEGMRILSAISIGLTAIFLSMIGFALFVLPRLIYQSQPRLRDQYRLTFSDEGIRFCTDQLDSMLKWTIYRSWLCDNEFYILFHGKRDITVLPRRAIADGRADEHLRRLLQRHIGSASSARL